MGVVCFKHLCPSDGHRVCSADSSGFGRGLFETVDWIWFMNESSNRLFLTKRTCSEFETYLVPASLLAALFLADVVS
jgi:hypothetical protein